MEDPNEIVEMPEQKSYSMDEVDLLQWMLANSNLQGAEAALEVAKLRAQAAVQQLVAKYGEEGYDLRSPGPDGKGVLVRKAGA